MGLFIPLYCLLLLYVSATIVRRHRNPANAWCWLLAVGLVPVGGMLLYLLTGYRKPDARQDPSCDGHPGLERLLCGGCGTFVRLHNRIERLHNGNNAFASLIGRLQSARKSIHLEYYIFKDDRIGQAICNILMRKARNGVEVRMICDAVGSWHLSRRTIRLLRASGVDLRLWGRIRFPWFSPKAHRRNHRKLAVIDGKTAYLGGINVARRYLGIDRSGHWRDEHLALEGDAVADLQRLFAADWYRVSGQRIPVDRYTAPHFVRERSPLQIAWSEAGPSRHVMTDLFVSMISSAQHGIDLSTPYLLPPPALFEALLRALRSGIRIRIMLPGTGDVRLAHLATDAYAGELLEAGAEIYRYTEGFLHAKQLIIDRSVASVGTANFDYRSLEINAELTAVSLDPEVVRDMTATFEEDLTRCRRDTLAAWRLRPATQRAASSVARLFAPLL